MVSGLTDNYPAEIVGIAKALNSLHPGAIKVIKFNGHADFAEKMANLINEVEPWGLRMNERWLIAGYNPVSLFLCACQRQLVGLLVRILLRRPMQ